MGEFYRVDPKGKTDRQLLVAALKQAEATHGCLEKHIAETRLAYLDATEKRQALAEDVLGLRTDVAEVKAAQAIDRQEVKAVALALGTRAPEAGEVKPPPPRAHIPWKELLKIAGAFSGIILMLQIVGPPTGRYVADVWASIMAANP